MPHLHPPVYFLITTSIGVSFRWVPCDLYEFPRWFLYPAIFLFFIGITLGAVSVYLFLKSHTGIIPFSPTTQVVQKGFYRLTRNPMYLGLLMIQASLMFTLGNLLSLAVIPVFWWILHTQFVVKEEKLLLEKFGEEYEQYLKQSRRWL